MSQPQPAAQTGATLGASAPLLEVDGLHIEFESEEGRIQAVNGISYELAEGETLVVVGESGSGKTVSSHAIMGLVESPPGYITGGEIRYRGQDLLSMPSAQRRRIRGREIALITQDALTSLNPAFTVGFQIGEMFRVHEGLSRREATRRTIDVLDRVQIPSAKQRLKDYPHQFSGGMCQRVTIAMALALNPRIIIADEPTTALDVTVEAQIMELLMDLQKERNMGMLLITHDLALASDVGHRVAVMYAGRIVETGPIADVYRTPAHPYTEGLLRSIPGARGRAEDLRPIQGRPPNLASLPPGCAFAARCDYARDRCREGAAPALVPVSRQHRSACHFTEEVMADGA